MNWWPFRWNPGKKKEIVARLNDEQLLIQEIRKAHRNWLNAQAQFEYAVDKDQVDYAIYILEATEKRYEMLLKQAKNQQIHAGSNFVMEA